MVNELGLVLEQRRSGALAGLGLAGGEQVLDAVPPQLGDAVERFGGVAARADGRIELMIQGVRLHIALYPQGFGVLAHERRVLVEPVGLEFLEAQSRFSLQAEGEFDHAIPHFSLCYFDTGFCGVFQMKAICFDTDNYFC